MKIVDAGVSGTCPVDEAIDWSDLDLQRPWPDVIECLAPGTRPRPVQIEALQRRQMLQTRRNLIVSAPTNSGKSLVGLLLLLSAIANGRRAVLLESLRAIAREQADDLMRLVPALTTALGRPLRVTISTGDYRLDDETLSAPPPDQGELIIATPERLEAILRNPDYAAWIESIGAICVDEAHLISSPRRGPTLEQLITSFLCLPAPPRIALLSATLGDVGHALDWLNPCDLVRVGDRCPPLTKRVLALSEGEEANGVVLAQAAQTLSDLENCLLVFVYQTKAAEALAAKLNEQLGALAGPKGASAYHARMSQDKRRQVQEAFRALQSRCLVTTTALGLGVNLPASHVIVRDNTFPGVGRLELGALLQMMGRAGRGDRAGNAAVLVRSTDRWRADELVRALQQEQVADFVSPYANDDRRSFVSNTDPERSVSAATLVASYLARWGDAGMSIDALHDFYARSLGAEAITSLLPAALGWLTDPMRMLAFADEQRLYRLTVLGRKATRATLPLPVAAGYAQLIRDLLTVDAGDRLLSRWQPLDHLIALHLLYDRSPKLRRHSQSLADQVDGWIEGHPESSPLLYTEWLRGRSDSSRADEVLGSLGIAAPDGRRKSHEWAHKQAYAALFGAIVLHERAHGTSVADLSRRWRIPSFDGVEERWRDDMLWLLSGLGRILELRAFFYHLKQQCDADSVRIRRVKQTLAIMRRQTYQLQTTLKYCSPLGHILHAMRNSSSANEKHRVGIGTIRRLEDGGILTALQLARLSVDDMVDLGVQRRYAIQIRRHMQRRQL